MIRRRLPKARENFSFDSFLDVVANVVGIIIRLILVVWVGARSYTHLVDQTPTENEPAVATAEVKETDEPVYRVMQEEHRQVKRLEADLLQELRLVQHERDIRRDMEPVEKESAASIEKLRQAEAQVRDAAARAASGLQQAAMTTEEIQARCKRLSEQIKNLQLQPVVHRVLHYRTPVSKAVQGDEFHFELREGRVAFVDIFGLLAEFTARREEIERNLQSSWQTTGRLGPIGAFQMLYTAERERGLIDSLGGDKPGTPHSFHYGMKNWQIQPAALDRGESLQEALRPGSAFREIADRLDAEQSAVTFWVYPDSFAAFRQLRDYLYKREITVAARPLPPNLPIAGSMSGTASRGQ
jgi:hypothetical protein